MMEEMNKWLSAHKQLCVITGIFGLLVSPFLWPVFLAVIIQSLSLVIPVAAGLFFYEKFIMKKDKEETNENDDDNKQQKKHADARKVHADAEKTEDLPKNHEKGSETVNFDNQEKQARCRAQAAIWYENEGFERIQAIRKTLESENRNRFSVNREGICSISIGKRKYRRVGILKGYHSISKDADEREHFENALRERTALLMSHQNETVEFGSAYEKYFYLHYDKDGVFLYPEEKTTVTERKISLCGYFVIITSERMTAKEALHLYKSRDVSEKLFASDKSFLGNKSMRSHTNEGVEGRIFTQFIALIIRNKIYTALQEENEKLEKKQNYMTVPAAIRELEKIEMTRQTDNVYRLDHAVTAKQKKILKAFGMNEGNITYRAGEISNTLKKSNIQKERR